MIINQHPSVKINKSESTETLFDNRQNKNRSQHFLCSGFTNKGINVFTRNDEFVKTTLEAQISTDYL